MATQRAEVARPLHTGFILVPVSTEDGAIPRPPTEQTRRRMQRQAVKDTGPEQAIRRELHARGLRYRIHAQPVPGLRRSADLVFARAKVAVFVDGCFWHRCPRHRTSPTSNGEWWAAKLAANEARDHDTNERLNAAGWTVVRVWEHVDPKDAADRIVEAVRGAIPRGSLRVVDE